jgi:ribosomal protein L11 methyltransferase
MSKWQEITVTTTEEAQEAVASLFYEIGAAGVVIGDPNAVFQFDADELWDSYEAVDELAEAGNVVIKGYLPIDDALKTRLEHLKDELARIGEYFTDYLAKVSLAEISEEDWSTSWKAYYKPEKVGRKIVIVPSWEKYEPNPEEIIVTLDPGMAFGTGNHPTTILSIRFLEKYLKEGDTVIDVGTGSGILAITAAKLGAKKVFAYDVDTVAVQVAEENVKVNKVENIVSTSYNDLLTGIDIKADLIVSNIIADIIIKLIPQAFHCLTAGGHFIASGIVVERWPDVYQALTKQGLTIIEVNEMDDWITAVARKE